MCLNNVRCALTQNGGFFQLYIVYIIAVHRGLLGGVSPFPPFGVEFLICYTRWMGDTVCITERHVNYSVDKTAHACDNNMCCAEYHPLTSYDNSTHTLSVSCFAATLLDLIGNIGMLVYSLTYHSTGDFQHAHYLMHE